jgi:hypothetical protein
VTIHTVVGEDQREFDLVQGPGQSAGGGVVAGDEQGHGAAADLLVALDGFAGVRRRPGDERGE